MLIKTNRTEQEVLLNMFIQCVTEYSSSLFHTGTVMLARSLSREAVFIPAGSLVLVSDEPHVWIQQGSLSHTVQSNKRVCWRLVIEKKIQISKNKEEQSYSSYPGYKQRSSNQREWTDPRASGSVSWQRIQRKERILVVYFKIILTRMWSICTTLVLQSSVKWTLTWCVLHVWADKCGETPSMVLQSSSGPHIWQGIHCWLHSAQSKSLHHTETRLLNNFNNLNLNMLDTPTPYLTCRHNVVFQSGGLESQNSVRMTWSPAVLIDPQLAALSSTVTTHPQWGNIRVYLWN